MSMKSRPRTPEVSTATTERNHGLAGSVPAIPAASHAYGIKEGEKGARTRRPRFRRPRRTKRGSLTERELGVLLFIARVGCVDTKAIQDGFFGRWPSPAQRALSRCFEGGYLNKLRGRAVNERDVYFISPSARRGYPIVEAALAAEGRRPAPLPPRVRLEETLGLARLAARVLRACRESGLVFQEWRGERELRPVPALGQLLPDAYLRVARSAGPGAKTASFFIEWETSEKALGYWEEKFRHYVDLYDSGRYEAAFGTRSLRVLLVLAAERGSGAKLRRLAGAAERTGATMVRLADWRELRAAPAADVLGAPLWMQPGREEPLALFAGATQTGSDSHPPEAAARGG